MKRRGFILIALGLIALVLLGLGLFLALSPETAKGQAALDRKNLTTIDFLDVGQGDSILIRSPEGKTALIDAGPSKDVVPLLRKLGVTSINLVAVSHHHADHFGGMDDVIRAFRPKYFLASNSSHATPAYLKLLSLVRDSGMTAIFPTDASRKIELGSVVLTVLPQPPENHQDENDNSIALRVQHGAFLVLLTGDSEARERAFWEANVPELVQNCTVLKLAHHGSRNGTDDRWLEIVRPKLAVASLGAANEYGHPHGQTLDLLDQRGIPLLRTDRDGTVEVVSDGKRWEIVGRPELARGPPDKSLEAQERDGKVTKEAKVTKVTKVTKEAKVTDRLIDLNSASLQELESLPGVGSVLARRIVEGRPYRTVDDLLKVKGIGEKRLAEIRLLVKVR
jgi:competence protein ComEC